MSLYTERNGIREPLEKTYDISVNMYSLLLNCCNKYRKNLIHIYNVTEKDDFTHDEYIVFDEKIFSNKIKMKIPNLYREDNKIVEPKYPNTYDQYSLLDFIEYFAKNIQDIHEGWNSDKYQNYRITRCLKTDNVFNSFKADINEIFDCSGLLYKLTDEKNIERIVEYSPLTKQIEENIENISEEGVRKLLKESIKRYKTPDNTSRQDSIEKLWDALERLKTYYYGDITDNRINNKSESANRIVTNIAGGNEYFFKLFNEEFKCLTSIGNNCRIRHHEVDKQEIRDIRYYDYLFNRCLSLIALAIQYLD